MNEPTDTWENIKWTNELTDRTIEYLDSRFTGGKDWITFVSKDTKFDLKEFKSQYPQIDFNKPIVGLLTNVIWDAQLHYPENIFDTMIDWIVSTISHFEKRLDLQLVIRVHPAEIYGEIKSMQQVKCELERTFPNGLPDNVVIIDADNLLSTYTVLSVCDSVLIYGTKTGVEMAARGCPVIVAGEAWIKGKGLTIDPKSQKEYFEELDKLPMNEMLTKDVKQRGIQYAHHFFFRRMIPVNQIMLTGTVPPLKLNVHTLSELGPGNDAGLDVICNGIVDGKDFVFNDEIVNN